LFRLTLVFCKELLNGRRYRQVRELADEATTRRICRLPRMFCGVGARIPKVWANARKACPDALTGSGARGVGRIIHGIFDIALSFTSRNHRT
jgi:hypothetical protein